MSRLLRAAILLLFLASCGGGNFTAPRNLDDACSINHQRPSYLSAMQVAQQKWSVPISVQMAVLYEESKFVGNARTPHHYALGHAGRSGGGAEVWREPVLERGRTGQAQQVADQREQRASWSR